MAHKLSIAPPSAFLVIKYLGAIAEEYNVEWTPADTGMDEHALNTQAMPGPTGFSVNVAPGSNLSQAYAPAPPQNNSAPVAEVIKVDNSKQHQEHNNNNQPLESYYDLNIPAAPGYENIPPPADKTLHTGHNDKNNQPPPPEP